jgi:hypothetical protein
MLVKSEADQGPNADSSTIIAWLVEFAEKIAKVDYAGASHLFSPAVFGFGTEADAYHSLEEWHQSQWRRVWPNTTGFRFELATLRTILSADRSLCCVACEWQSDGIREDGSVFPRRGRSTVLLSSAGDGDARWIGVHSHFSLPPKRD